MIKKFPSLFLFAKVIFFMNITSFYTLNTHIFLFKTKPFFGYVTFNTLQNSQKDSIHFIFAINKFFLQEKQQETHHFYIFIS